MTARALQPASVGAPERSVNGPRRPILVLGLGNILLRDEGVGVRVIEALASHPLPADVELCDGATAGLGLLDVLADRRKVIVVDALAGDRPPGTVLRLTRDDLAEPAAVLSVHEFGLLETLAAARLLGLEPDDVVVFGVRPEAVEYGLELSPTIARLVPELVARVLTELEISATGAASPREADSEGQP